MNHASAVEAVLFAALDKPIAAERAALLDSACAGDAELRRRVEKLLKAHANVGDFLQTPVVEQLAVTPVPADVTQEVDAANGHEGVSLVRTAGEGASDDEDSPLDFLQPSTRPDSLGRLGHYEVLEVLGKGGFGTVFRAFDNLLQRVVAIKVLSARLAATAPARKRFLREARSSAKVRHDNVVQVYAVEEQPLPYLVMEYIPGETLQQRIDRTGPMETQEVQQIGRQIADGLAAAHAQGLIHRDIKPGNILLEQVSGEVVSGEWSRTSSHHSPRAKITDFGLARAADDASLSQSGTIAGTPMYMAPEQAQGDRIDHRADLFSLGSVLYTISSGRPPFRANNTLAILKRVAEDTPEVIHAAPTWLHDLIAKLHAKKPEDRFQSAREVADLLGRQAEMQSIRSAPIAEVGLRIADAKTEERPTVALANPRSVRRSPIRTFWAVAAALLLIGAGIWLYQIIIIRDKDGKEVARIKVPEGGKVEVVEDKKVDPKHTPWAATPDQQVWLDAVARMPLAERLKALTQKLTDENKVFVKFLLEPNDGPPTKCTITGGNPQAIWPLLALPSLTSLDLTATAVTDFTPLARLRLTELVAHVIVDNVKSEAALKSMATLKTINGQPAAEYWAERPALRKEIDDMVVSAPALSLEGRQEWFKSVMKRLHPKWTGNSGGGLSKDKTNGLMALSFILPPSDERVYDFSPLRALDVEAVHLARANHLCDLSPLAKSKVQIFRYVNANGSLRDLSPLAGLPLKELDLTGAWSLVDLSPLAGMKLESFQLWHFANVKDVRVLLDMPITSLALPYPITDLRPFKTMKLTSLACSATDLASLAGMPLESLTFRVSRPADLAPLAGMKLKQYTSIDANGAWLWFRSDYEPDEKMFRAMPLVSINGVPAAKFWAAYDADRKALEDFVTETARLAPADAVAAVNEAIKQKGRALEDSRIEDGAVVEVKVSSQLAGKFGFNSLGPLKAFPRLKKITIVDNYHPHWQNLAPLMKLPIEEIVCVPTTVASNAIILRQIPTLKTINGKPAQEVLAAVK